jgi:hypothetical protein
LANDNIYAYYLLNKMGHPLAARIKNGLDRFGIWSNKKAELVLNKTIESFYTPYYPSVANISGYHVMVEMPNKSIPETNFDKYADLCFWWS